MEPQTGYIKVTFLIEYCQFCCLKQCLCCQLTLIAGIRNQLMEIEDDLSKNKLLWSYIL